MIQTKTYILKSKDIPLLSFAYHKDTSRSGKDAYSLEIQNVYDNNAYLLPKGLRREDGDKAFQDELYTWLTKRKIPVGRTNALEVIKYPGDTENPLRYVQITRGLSLNDAYWVVTPEDGADWGSCNLYTNPFDVLLERIAFEGEVLGIKTIEKEDKRINSPEPNRQQHRRVLRSGSVVR